MRTLQFNRIYEFSQQLKLVFIVIAIAIVTISTIFTNRLAKSLAAEERHKIEIWAEATRQLIQSNNETDINFALSIIEANTTIPVVIIDEKDNIMQSRNITEPDDNKGVFYKNVLTRLKTKNPPIELHLDDNTTQYFYYDDSKLLKQLYYFPFVQFGIIIIFLLVAFFAFSSTKKAEQNRVWVGLSKETAHQLGTPISSLLGWVDLLKLKYPDNGLMNEMEKDVNRLKIIAERFSKIGSKPDLKLVSLNESVENVTSYIRNRTSQKISISCHYSNNEHIFIALNVPLFEWVIENLCKNAIDAMNGSGAIDVYIYQTTNEIIMDVQDTGKGIDKRKFKLVFNPGFTTKERGWGLGLSLAKRIIEEYHGGKIFIKDSEVNVGTVFRIVFNSRKKHIY